MGYTERGMHKHNGSPTSEVGARDLLTVAQAASCLQLSPSSIRAYMRQRKLRAFRVAGLRKVLIPRAELLALLEPTEPRPGDSRLGQRPAA